MSSATPTVAKSVQQFVAVHRFELFEFEVTLLSSYYVGVRFTWSALHFKAVWANPLWEWFGADVSAQLERLSERVRSCTEAAVDLDWLRTPLHKTDIPAGVYHPGGIAFGCT